MARRSPHDALRAYREAQSLRSPYENDWRSASAYCLPRQYNSWNTIGPTIQANNNSAAARIAYDTTGTRALKKYIAVLNRLCTPETQRWSAITAADPYLRKQYAVRKYFEDVTNLLHDQRYGARARFIQAANEVYSGIGVYGMGPVFVGKRKKFISDMKGGPIYRALHMKDVYILVDDEGNVDVVFRRFYLTARAAAKKFGEDKLPPKVANEYKKPGGPSESTWFEFVHIVCPRDDYDPKSLAVNRHPWEGSYLAVEDVSYIGEEEGFRNLPYLTPRVFTEADNPYGYSPAMEAMPALGDVSAMKKTLLKQGQKAVDPPLLANDDGVLSGRLDIRAGKVNYGGITADGKKLVQPIEMGNFNVGENLIADERNDINDSFFVTLFQILTETPEMTATEVIERVAEKASLLSPTMGRLQAEFLGPMIDREIDVAFELGLLPEPPPEIVESGGQFTVQYSSPLAKSMYAESISGFMRTVEMATNVAQAKQDPSLLDPFDFDTAIPEIADHLGAPSRWMKAPDQIAAARADREDQIDDQKLVQAAPAIASVAGAAMKNRQTPA